MKVQILGNKKAKNIVLAVYARMTNRHNTNVLCTYLPMENFTLYYALPNVHWLRICRALRLLILSARTILAAPCLVAIALFCAGVKTIAQWQTSMLKYFATIFY